YVESHRLGRLDRRRPFGWSEPGGFGRPPAVEVGAEITRSSSTLHRGHHLPADYEGTDVGSSCFLDVLLHQEVGVQLAEGPNHRLGGLACFRQDDSESLSALEQLHDDRRPSDDVEEAAHVLSAVRSEEHTSELQSREN